MSKSVYHSAPSGIDSDYIDSCYGIGNFSDFGLFYQVPMNSGTLINATNTIDTYVSRFDRTGDISMSSAACVYQSLVDLFWCWQPITLPEDTVAENALF